jgi:hypothetical protein
MWRIGWTPNNVSKWQMGFNSAFKGLSGSLRKSSRKNENFPANIRKDIPRIQATRLICRTRLCCNPLMISGTEDGSVLKRILFGREANLLVKMYFQVPSEPRRIWISHLIHYIIKSHNDTYVFTSLLPLPRFGTRNVQRIHNRYTD